MNKNIAHVSLQVRSWLERKKLQTFSTDISFERRSLVQIPSNDANISITVCTWPKSLHETRSRCPSGYRDPISGKKMCRSFRDRSVDNELMVKMIACLSASKPRISCTGSVKSCILQYAFFILRHTVIKVAVMPPTPSQNFVKSCRYA